MTTPTFTHILQDEFLSTVLELGRRIQADDWGASFIVGIGRGGLVPAVFLSHAIGLPTLSVDRSSGVADFADAPLIPLARRTREGEKLIFVDDINDSGRTITSLRAALAEAGAVLEQVRFATLIDNVSSAERVDYSVTEIDRKTRKDWFVFPWEAVAPDASLADDAAAVPERIA